MTNFLTFTLSGEYFAVRVERVEEVHRMVWPTRVADAPPGIAGVSRLGEELAVIVDLAGRLGLARRPLSLEDYLIFVRSGTSLVGLRVQEIIGLSAQEPTPVPEQVHAPAFVGGYLEVEGNSVSVLDVVGMMDMDLEAVLLAAESTSPSETSPA